MLGTLPPPGLKYIEPISTKNERHILGVQHTAGSNRLAKVTQMGDLDAVKQLILSETASIHSISRLGEPLLHIAASHAHPEVVAFLLRSGADRGMQNAEGKNAFEVISAFVEKAGDKYHEKRLRWRECEALLSPESIFTAAKSGNIRRMKWLLANER